jgi:hypothetical protein
MNCGRLDLVDYEAVFRHHFCRLERKLNRGKVRVRGRRRAIPAIPTSHARSAPRPGALLYLLHSMISCPLFNHANEVNVDALTASPVPFIEGRWFAATLARHFLAHVRTS